MFQTTKPLSFGFSMVELLVTLVLLGLVASFVAPNVNTWLSSRDAAATRMAISSKLAMLPLQVNRKGEALTITNASQLDLAHIDIVFEQPIEILANGFCMGGELSINQNQRVTKFEVLAPYCEVVLSENQ
ncbi:prepilin-type N-terminal cleavage/methylation domain-containing protein [Paraglaciecola aestuariivivens]